MFEDKTRQFHANRKAEEEARHTMRLILWVLFAAVACVAVAMPLLYTFVCSVGTAVSC